MKGKAERFKLHKYDGDLAPHEARFAILDGKDNWPEVAEVRDEKLARLIVGLLNSAALAGSVPS